MLLRLDSKLLKPPSPCPCPCPCPCGDAEPVEAPEGDLGASESLEDEKKKSSTRRFSCGGAGRGRMVHTTVLMDSIQSSISCLESQQM
jgi:hypothetical protein